MIKHTVLRKLKDGTTGRSKPENTLLLKQRFENLNGVIPGIRLLEAGININHTGSDVDVVLYSEFGDLVALQAYYPHPEHIKLNDFVEVIRCERWVIEYQI